MWTSSQVCWWRVHEWVTPLLSRVEEWPLAGSPLWDVLADNDPVKLAAVLDGGRHWALRIDTNQEAMAEAGRAISKSADWKGIAHRTANPSSAYIPRRKEFV